MVAKIFGGGVLKFFEGVVVKLLGGGMVKNFTGEKVKYFLKMLKFFQG